MTFGNEKTCMRGPVFEHTLNKGILSPPPPETCRLEMEKTGVDGLVFEHNTSKEGMKFFEGMTFGNRKMRRWPCLNILTFEVGDSISKERHGK